MFVVMARSSLIGVYETAYVAIIAIVMLWFVMVTSLPSLAAFDLQRQAARRSDFCPCLPSTHDEPSQPAARLSRLRSLRSVQGRAGRAPADEHDKGISASIVVTKYVYERLYSAAITRRPWQLVIIVLSLAMLVTCAVKVGSLPLGLELSDFAEEDTWEARGRLTCRTHMQCLRQKLALFALIRAGALLG